MRLTTYTAALRQQRLQRLQTAAAVLVAIPGFIAVLLPEKIADLLWTFGYPASPSTDTTTLLFGVLLLMSGVALLMLQYLRGGLFSSSRLSREDLQPEPFTTASILDLRDRVNSLANEIKILKTAQLDALSGSHQELLEALKPTVHAGVADELERRFRERASQFARDEEIRESFATAERRLKDELGALGLRSNLNLVIGVLTTSMAVGLLMYMVLGVPAEFGGLTALLSHYIPRLGLILFIEVFSFFFLRLYKTTLAEMRMYQTDLTTLTVQHVAVVAALSTGDSASATALSRELLGVRPDNQKPTEDQNENVDPKALAELVRVIAKLVPAKAKDA